jgi:hypothetical protein
MSEKTEAGVSLMAEAALLLQAAVADDETWEWEATPNHDGGQIESSKGGLVVYIPPFANVRTAQRAGTTYNYNIARLVEAAPRLIRGLLKEFQSEGWRTVSRAAGPLPGAETVTKRLEVPGGWLYETTLVANEGPGRVLYQPQVVFVPKPA